MTTDNRLQSILDATGRLLGRGGTDAVTMRAVADEAGVSLRLVQYYGKSRDELLGATLDQLSARSLATWRNSAQDASPEDILASFLDASLPLSEETRALHRAGVSMELMAVTGREPGASAYRRHLDAVAGELTAVLTAAGQDDATARVSAFTLMAFGHGLGSLVMTETVTADDARTTAEAFLQRM